MISRLAFAATAWSGSMKTAAEYRAMADECLKWAREARTNEVRASYLQLAQIWLNAASELDTPTRTPPTPDDQPNQRARPATEKFPV